MYFEESVRRLTTAAALEFNSPFELLFEALMGRAPAEPAVLARFVELVDLLEPTAFAARLEELVELLIEPGLVEVRFPVELKRSLCEDG